jgi:hypothetical protein
VFFDVDLSIDFANICISRVKRWQFLIFRKFYILALILKFGKIIANAGNYCNTVEK